MCPVVQEDRLRVRSQTRKPPVVLVRTQKRFAYRSIRSASVDAPFSAPQRPAAPRVHTGSRVGLDIESYIGAGSGK